MSLTAVLTGVGNQGSYGPGVQERSGGLPSPLKLGQALCHPLPQTSPLVPCTSHAPLSCGVPLKFSLTAAPSALPRPRCTGWDGRARGPSGVPCTGGGRGGGAALWGRLCPEATAPRLFPPNRPGLGSGIMGWTCHLLPANCPFSGPEQARAGSRPRCGPAAAAAQHAASILVSPRRRLGCNCLWPMAVTGLFAHIPPPPHPAQRTLPEPWKAGCWLTLVSGQIPPPERLWRRIPPLGRGGEKRGCGDLPGLHCWGAWPLTSPGLTSSAA